MLDGMTNIKASEVLKELKLYTEDLPHYSPDEVAEALEMANKALEQQPNRCDSCIHYEEQDGSNCYECVKGMADNFEAQPKTSYISVDLNKFAKEVAEKALDEITYEGKTLREWAEIIFKQQPSENVLDNIKAEIIEKFDNCSICEWFEDYDYDENDISEYISVGHISDIIDIIDKYRKGGAE